MIELKNVKLTDEFGFSFKSMIDLRKEIIESLPEEYSFTEADVIALNILTEWYKNTILLTQEKLTQSYDLGILLQYINILIDDNISTINPDCLAATLKEGLILAVLNSYNMITKTTEFVTEVIDSVEFMLLNHIKKYNFEQHNTKYDNHMKIVNDMYDSVKDITFIEYIKVNIRNAVILPYKNSIELKLAISYITTEVKYKIDCTSDEIEGITKLIGHVYNFIGERLKQYGETYYYGYELAYIMPIVIYGLDEEYKTILDTVRGDERLKILGASLIDCIINKSGDYNKYFDNFYILMNRIRKELF